MCFTNENDVDLRRLWLAFVSRDSNTQVSPLGAEMTLEYPLVSRSVFQLRKVVIVVRTSPFQLPKQCHALVHCVFCLKLLSVLDTLVLSHQRYANNLITLSASKTVSLTRQIPKHLLEYLPRLEQVDQSQPLIIQVRRIARLATRKVRGRSIELLLQKPNRWN